MMQDHPERDILFTNYIEPSLYRMDESMRFMISQLMERRQRQEPYRRSAAPDMLLRGRIYEIVAVTLDQHEDVRNGILRRQESREEALERIGKRVRGEPFTNIMQAYRTESHFNSTLNAITAQVIQEIDLYRECFPESGFHFMRLPWMEEQF